MAALRLVFIYPTKQPACTAAELERTALRAYINLVIFLHTRQCKRIGAHVPEFPRARDRHQAASEGLCSTTTRSSYFLLTCSDEKNAIVK